MKLFDLRRFDVTNMTFKVTDESDVIFDRSYYVTFILL